MAIAIAHGKGSRQGRSSALPMAIAIVVVCVLLAAEPGSASSRHGVRSPRRSFGRMYRVGDNGMWMLGSKVSYNKWAASKIFRQNDKLLFTFNPTFHNLMLVSAADYMRCSPRKPMVIYTKGKIDFTLAKKGTYFFICGIPGHCQAGMKMAIKVL
ncbi:hypothetical protein KP509_29G063900 [Ceratopteris richardii]|uniref:Phytocyanin domain-containing protein n=1 Tax=Ceratopteris richardii TaxID=49495 RepID=A0A8T2RA41_CERRI|nr:hypothetical protein KP509_29G063900 [Ceratopteris richardii]